MSSELSNTVQVPQVFEVGARVAFVPANPHLGGWARVLVDVRGGDVWGVDEDGDESIVCPAGRATPGLRVIAPAPREGQLWSLGGDTPIPLKAAEGKVFDSLAIAKSFLTLGLDYAGPADAAPATLRASEAAAVEPTPATAPPAPWTLTAARRLIAETIASAKPRRPDAFTAAMCSMAEDETPHASVIRAVAVALCALEESLPEYGAAAEWHVERARARAEDVFRSAAQLEHVPAAVREAFEMYVARRS